MNPRTLDRPLRVVRVCLHLLVAALLLLAVVRAVAGYTARPVVVAAAAAAVAAIYAAGPLLRRVGRSRAATGTWLLLLGLAWLVLLGLTPDGVWLAFPLFFVQLHLLPLVPGLVAVAATTLAAIAGFAWHQQGVTPAGIIGPALGAAVAVATVLGYLALHRENEQRKRLIEELTEARDELAAAEHAAGVHAERERLATEIHDTVAQGLSSIQLLLRAAERALPAEPVTAAEHVRQARDAAQDNLVQVRRLVRALAPAELDGTPLPAALRRLCEQTATQSGLAVHFHTSGELATVPTAYEVALLRIAQSALANTVRHAAASRAEITLSYMDDGVTLDAVDDGIGFDPATTIACRAGEDSDGGFGLAAMRARVRSLGGTLAVESAPGQGTALAVSFPYRHPEGQSP
ncbi:sensor histidine kinase [Haloechinothrix sp. LS1_15]|uniref:sensor histidine kinase n=1 Tax=Haloechinothrix sp. LS1_15 TaxID=2652248 RepID=UPI002946B183|nr:sensor histidine kinase [Haloechinothrix sp. LS1_15]MDV6012547.1 sensor histidine kinase [Haloechinothrix sp. LS1_15]